MSDFTSIVKFAQAMLVYNDSLVGPSKGTTSIDTIISRTGFRVTFDKAIPALFSFHGLDVIQVVDSDKKLTELEKSIAKKAFYDAIEEIGTKKYRVLNLETLDKINSIIQNIVNTIQAASSLSEDTSAVTQTKNELDEHVRSLNEIFKRPYIVSYQDKGQAVKNYGTEGQPSVRILTRNFSGFRSTINSTIKKHLEKLIAKNFDKLIAKQGFTLLEDSTYLTSKLSNWGHTRTDSGLVSSKLIMSLVKLKNLNVPESALKAAVTNYEEVTGQSKTIINMTVGDLRTGDREVLKLVLNSSLFQKVLLQNPFYNQKILGTLEKNWNIVDLIKGNSKESIKFRRAIGLKKADIATFLQQLIPTRASPSLLDKIETKMVGALKGIDPKIAKTGATLPALNTVLKRKRTRVKLQPKSDVGKIVKGSSPPIAAPASELDLNRLLNSLNQQITQQIRQNMGTGYSKDVLNYRTGRFANSVKVERLSESRAGMITAFLSYMKYPYATFSKGGRQQYPRSRDPKTLISKSVREIAATLVTNRLRTLIV